MINANGIAGILLGIILAAHSWQSAADVKEPTIVATVCNISSSPKQFSGKIVKVSGELTTDGIERTAVIDKNCDKVGIAIAAPQHFKGEAEYKRILEQGSPVALGKEINGTFIGRFIWKPREVPSRILQLQEVRDLSVAMK